MFLSTQINVPVILQGPSMYTLSDEFKDLSDAVSQMGTWRTVPEVRHYLCRCVLQIRGQSCYHDEPNNHKYSNSKSPHSTVSHSVQHSFLHKTSLKDK